MRLRSLRSLAALLLLALPPAVRAESDPDALDAAPAASTKHRAFSSARGTFSCEVPSRGWQAFEEETPWGSSAHFLGPAEEHGTWRAAVHVHFVEKGQPGFVPVEDAVKRARRSDASAERSAGTIRRSRVAGRSARRFEVTETRLAPADRLPSAPLVLHHYLAYVPASDGYFVIKVSTSRETYLAHRELFEHILRTFRILGHP